MNEFIPIINWVVFFFLLLHWLHGEKAKMHLYEIWMDKHDLRVFPKWKQPQSTI